MRHSSLSFIFAVGSLIRFAVVVVLSCLELADGFFETGHLFPVLFVAASVAAAARVTTTPAK